MNEKDLSVRWKRGRGNGGQHRNKTENCCVLTHVPTGITVTVDGRSRRSNRKAAVRLLEKELYEREIAEQKQSRKAQRDARIHDKTRVRTYDYSRGLATDHLRGTTAPVKDVLEKGQLDKLLK